MWKIKACAEKENSLQSIKKPNSKVLLLSNNLCSRARLTTTGGLLYWAVVTLANIKHNLMVQVRRPSLSVTVNRSFNSASNRNRRRSAATHKTELSLFFFSSTLHRCIYKARGHPFAINKWPTPSFLFHFCCCCCWSMNGASLNMELCNYCSLCPSIHLFTSEEPF